MSHSDRARQSSGLLGAGMDDGRDRTILLVSSDRLACTALRQILVAQRPWHLLADVREFEAAPAIVAVIRMP